MKSDMGVEKSCNNKITNSTPAFEIEFEFEFEIEFEKRRGEHILTNEQLLSKLSQKRYSLEAIYTHPTYKMANSMPRRFTK
jgi:hypothetical protein